MIRLLFLISDLNRGGAQRQLTLLVQKIDRARFALTVVTIYDGGTLRGEIEAIEGVKVSSLHKKGRKDIPVSVWRLARIFRRVRPHIVHGYLDVANVVALLLGKPAGVSVVWGLRSSNVDHMRYGRAPAFYFRLAAMLSRFADLIVANSHAGRRHHVMSGYTTERMIVIPNGFDTEQFRPDNEAGQRMRHVWGIAENAPLVGLVARLDPVKDHPNFLRAAARLADARPDVRFICIGKGPASIQRELQTLADQLGLGKRLVWAGEMDDMCAAHNALDIATSSSTSEGFPNAIGEAMACGIPCVVTDVGDSAILVGDTGLVVPPGDPAALATAWAKLLDMPAAERTALGCAARERITSEYSLQELTRKTEAALATLVLDPD